MVKFTFLKMFVAYFSTKECVDALEQVLMLKWYPPQANWIADVFHFDTFVRRQEKKKSNPFVEIDVLKEKIINLYRILSYSLK